LVERKNTGSEWEKEKKKKKMSGKKV